LFEAIARRTFEGGADPVAAAAIKIANIFVLGCAIEAAIGHHVEKKLRRIACLPAPLTRSTARSSLTNATCRPGSARCWD
jgi:hypothetical protein